ncbi:hypothetical protein ACFQL1_21630 [Halomicroarcula sp. GCM10025709]
MFDSTATYRMPPSAGRVESGSPGRVRRTPTTRRVGVWAARSPWSCGMGCVCLLVSRLVEQFLTVGEMSLDGV